MKKMRLHIYIILGLFIITFILGSFFDLSLSTAIYSEKNTFGLLISVVGTMPGYLVLSFIGGGLFLLGLKRKEYKMIFRILLIALSIGSTACSLFFIGREFFGENGFTNTSISWLGYIIALPFCGGIFYLGYRISAKSTISNLWLIYLISLIFISLALLPGVSLLKIIFHRPRFRSIEAYEDVTFHSWWQRCTNYKDLIAKYSSLGLTKEEFKSFPSGHAGASMVFPLFICIMPLINKKLEKIQIPLYYVGVLWTLVVAFSRILVGAHFLSDVSMGGIITSICMLINNEIIIKANSKSKFEQTIE